MKAFKWIFFATIAAAIVLPGAAFTADPGKIRPSGFLENYDELTPDPTRPGVYLYEAPDLDPKDFDRFIIQFDIWFDKDSKHGGVNPDRLKAISDRLLEALTEELEPDYPIVRKAGPGVALMRVALTQVYVQKGKWTWKNFTPIGAIGKAAQTAAGVNFRISAAQLEVESLNSQTGQRLGAMVVPYAGEKLRKQMQKEKKNPETTWKDIENTLEALAKRFRQRIDERRGT